MGNDSRRKGLGNPQLSKFSSFSRPLGVLIKQKRAAAVLQEASFPEKDPAAWLDASHSAKAPLKNGIVSLFGGLTPAAKWGPTKAPNEGQVAKLCHPSN
jgi:hypothetical protein